MARTTRLVKFMAWQHADGIQESSALQYASYVQAMMNKLGVGIRDPLLVQTYYEARSVSTRRQLRSAWAAFRRFAQAQGQELPPLVSQEAVEAPMEVCRAVLSIALRDTWWTILARARWQDIRWWVIGPVELYDTTGGGYVQLGTGKIGYPAIQILYEWARPPTLDAPLVPTQPQSTTPRTRKELLEMVAAPDVAPILESSPDALRDRYHWVIKRRAELREDLREKLTGRRIPQPKGNSSSSESCFLDFASCAGFPTGSLPEADAINSDF